MKSNLESLLEKQYEQLKTKNRLATRIKREKIYKEIPEIKSLYDSIAKNTLEYSLLCVKNKNSNNLSELLKSNREITNRIKKILVANNYDSNYLDETYACYKCKDTGYILANGNTQRCSCYLTNLMKAYYINHNEKFPVDISFSNFEESYYPLKSVNNNKNAPTVREYMNMVKNSLIHFIDTFSASKQDNYFLFGKTGVGKTFLSISLAKYALDSDIPALYLTSNTLFNIINTYKASLFQSKTVNKLEYRWLYSIPLLIIDDLGTEPRTDAKYAELLEIINKRISLQLPMIISSNLDPAIMKANYDERIYSRIIGHFNVTKLVGEDIRLLKKRSSRNQSQ